MKRVVIRLAKKIKGSLPIAPNYGDNQVVNHPILDDAEIIFKGKNNILYFGDAGVTLRKCKIIFHGDNSVVYLSSNIRKRYHIDIHVYGNSSIYIGKDTSFHWDFQNILMASEEKNIIIGDDCLFSLGCWFRTSDAHSAYDAATKKRLNPGKSILIGDHVWFGQNVTILKGSVVGSGAIIGANSIVPGKRLISNTSYAGSPVREVKRGVFFTRNRVNQYTTNQLEQSLVCDTDKWIYSHTPSSSLLLETIDHNLSKAKTSEARLAYMQKHIVNHHSKNRFYVGDQSYQQKSKNKHTRRG